MRKTTLVIAVILVLATGLMTTGCVRIDRYEEEGDRTTKQFGITGFTEIQIGDAFRLEIIPSDTFSIAITAGDKVMEKLDVHKSGETLVIDIEGLWFNFHQSPEAVITMPVLEGLDMSGATRGIVRGFNSDIDLDLNLSGASSLEMDMETGRCEMDISGASRVTGSLVAGNIDMDVSGASNVDLDGSGGDIQMSVSGASRFEMAGFQVEDADVGLSGASSGSLDIYGTLDAALSGASRFTYSGEPSLGDFNITGGSSINSR